MTYKYKKKVDLKFEQAVEKVREELKKEGFEHIKGFEEVHNTPFQTTQCFVWNMFRKL